MSDIRQAFRILLKTPGFSAVVVAIVAIGVAATSTLFSVVDAVLLEPLAFPESSRLVAVTGFAGGTEQNISLPDLKDWQAQSTIFTGLAGYAAVSLTLTGRGRAVSVQAAAVTANLFGVLEAAPILGRTLSADDDQHRSQVAVISERMWVERFARRRSALGESLVLDGRPLTVVGVMPARFAFPVQADAIDVWVPVSAVGLVEQWTEQRNAQFLNVIGRLASGRTLAQANAELDAINTRLATSYPKNAGRTARAESLQARLVGNHRLMLLVLGAAVAMLLLIACGNVANLLLVRATTRSREMAVRAAMGASRWRLIRQPLAESVVLSAVAGCVGIGVTVWAVPVLVTSLPLDVPRLRDAHFSPLVFAFAIAVSIATGVLFGLAPALQLSAAGDAHLLQAATHGGSINRGSRTRQALVVVEVALSLVLVGSAGLLLRSLVVLQHVDPGFVVEHTLGTSTLLPDANYHDRASLIAVSNRLIESARLVSGVTAAGVSTTLPMTGSDINVGFSIEGRPRSADEEPSVTYFSVSPDYFRAMGIRLLNGRTFNDHDDEHGRDVVIVSDTMARRYWPHADAIGKRLAVAYNNTGLREVVGVVADVKNASLADMPQPAIYTPFAQIPWPVMGLVVRTQGEPAAVKGSLASALAKAAPDLPFDEPQVLSTFVSKTTATPRLLSIVVGLFAAVASLLAGCGLFSVMAFAVAQRRREIGIRMALGACAADVRALVVGQAMRLGAIGVVCGLAGAIAAGRLFQTLLFQVRPTDPVVLAGASLGVGLVVAIAALVPARRATRVDPAHVLRAE